ncbi:MAG: phosphopentomutase [Actinomycetota bacterium]|nr:phosphopentomutase [Actinomycetota bacterium]MDQ5808468.1 phosphopentomutase [Actinomycetota bacterium]
MSRRAFVVVLDACGVGALPDAADYGDAGTNTLAHLADALGGLELPALATLGLGSILPIRGVPPADDPAIHGRLHALGPGKDSTTGHWELMGVVPDTPPPTYPDGFPPEVVAVVGRVAGRGVLCNRPYNGIAALDDFGAEHLETGRLILYTSQDSVLQIAAHDAVLPVADLQAVCSRVRDALPREHPVGRVIARPFTGEPGAFERLPGRKDFSLLPPRRSYLEELQEAGIEVHSVGKVADLFAAAGIDWEHPGATNDEALAHVTALVEELDAGFVFANLVETDQLYGHRKDMEGFAQALRDVDACVATWVDRLRPEDLLILTADHGVDMTAQHTDHTREYVPLLATGVGVAGGRHDGPLADVGATVLHWLAGREAPGLPGSAFVDAVPAS